MRYLILSLLFCCQLSMAGTNEQNSFLTGSSLVPGSSLQVVGNRYVSAVGTPIANRPYWIENSFGLVKLSYADMTSITRPSGVASVALSITYDVETNSGFQTLTTTSTLKVQLGNSISTDVSYLKLEGAHRIQVNVLTTAGTNIPPGWNALRLDLSVITQSFDYLSLNALTVPGFSLSHNSTVSADNNLNVNWTAVPGAESYELEWTYISDQDPNNVNNRISASSIEIDRFLFKNNSSRVEIFNGLSYAIPLIYEKGIVLYRLRAVGKNVVNNTVVNVKTEWTAPDAFNSNLSEFPVANRFLYDGLEEKLNWQSSISFAEEGKNKVVLSYHDGSGRARQAVTRVNTDQRSILGETWYDYNGRPVIQTLPVPVANNFISYVPNFNIIEGKTQFDKADIDKGSTGIACATVSPVLSTSIGASQYYSSNNSFGSLGNTGPNLLNRNLIPDAGKFPYTQTLYKADNTGRIAAQSGVGSAYTIGSNRETKYFYGTPQQEELSRLFGNQVGYAGHYKKNAVIDPNGQTSVSYLDLEGRVVATALAGPPPPNVSALSGSNTRTIKSDLLASGAVVNQVSPDKISKIFNTNFVVVNPNTVYKFDYNATVGTYSLRCQNSSAQNQINYSLAGVVDVVVTLKDNCGATVFTQNAASAQNFSGGANQSLAIPQTVTLQTGQYQLSKTVTINTTKLNQYWESYLSSGSGTCILNQRNFIDEETSKINTVGCGITCAQCTTQVNNLLAQNLLLEPSERERLIAACDKLCEDKDITCKSALDAMSGDLSPGGQYAELRVQKINTPGVASVSMDVNNLPKSSDADVTFNKTDGSSTEAGDPDDNTVDPTKFRLSIFNEYNALRANRFVSGQPSWRRPIAISSSAFSKFNGNNQILNEPAIDLSTCSYNETNYKDSRGNIYYVSVYQTTSITGDNSTIYLYKPQVSDVNQLVLVDQSTGLYKIPVKYLQNVADVEKVWQKDWSNYLIPYHPEFEYLVECSKQNTNNSFDYLMYKTTSIEDAINLGYISSVTGFPIILGNSRANCKDPFFSSSNLYYNYIVAKNAVFKSTLTLGGINTTNVSMNKMATILVGCPKGQSNCGVPGCLDGIINTDDEWNAYKGLYLGEKQALIRSIAQKKAVDGRYYNGCIGNKDYLTSSESDYFKEFGNWWGRFGNFNPSVQLCNSNDASLYFKKTPRFYPGQPNSPSGKQLGTSCKTLIQNGTDDPVSINVPCDDDLDDFTEDVNTDVLRAKYESCGLCPLAKDVEQLLMDLKDNKALATVTSPGLILSCQNGNFPVTPGDLLLSEFKANATTNATNPDFFWRVTLSSNGRNLVGTVSNTNISIALAYSSLVPSTVNSTFANLTKLCCLSVLGYVNPTNTTLGQVFVMQSAYPDPILGDVPFLVTGTVNLGLAPCSFPPKCQTTDDASRVAQFLNILTATASGTNKTNDLVTSSADKTLSDASVIDFYQNAVRTLIKKDNYDVPGGYIQDMSSIPATWNSQVSSDGTKLSGVFQYVLNGDTKTIIIDINNLPTGFAFSDIRQFFRIRPNKNLPLNDPCRTSNCNKQKFLVDAIIVQGDSRFVKTVEIEVPSLNPVVCRPPIIIGSN